VPAGLVGTRPVGPFQQMRSHARAQNTDAPTAVILDLCGDSDDSDPVAHKDDQSRRHGDNAASWLRLPFSTPEFVNRLVTGSVNELGRRTLHMTITTWDIAGGGPFAANAIASAGLAKTVDVVQSMLMGPVFDPMLRAIGADRIKLRASLCASQLVGIGIMRYAVRVEPLASMGVDELVDAVAPTMQRYLTGDIG